MKYDSITIDTNIFDCNSLNLEGGMLGQLTQFKGGSAKLVFSEIVVQEVRKHLVDKTREAGNKLTSAIKNAVRQKVVSEDDGKQLNKIVESFPPHEDVVENRINAFIEATGADIVPADSVDIKDLIKSYFSSLSPFDKTGGKKNEFPDAIALLSLEKWAKRNQQKILAISCDKGWGEFASNSEWVDVEKDLAFALARFQEHAEAALAFVSRLVSGLVSEKQPDMMEHIVDYVARKVSSRSVYAKASSAYDYELEEPVELEYENLSFLKHEDDYDIDIVQTGKDLIVARIGLSISVKATGNFLFDFEINDRTERDYVHIGGCTSEKKLDFDAAILVTLEGDFIDQNNGVDISEIEITQMIECVDFGEIDPDYSYEYYG